MDEPQEHQEPHFANYRESWEADKLIDKGLIHPTVSKVYTLENTGQAALDVHHNLHQGKVGVLCLAPEEGLGVRDEDKRAKHIDKINRFRGIWRLSKKFTHRARARPLEVVPGPHVAG
ncbi:hypothetical protein [Aeromicrobium sp. UC242_57]|uniref:hypothetical protein n=1 Tax=Aeromicrobium sp. UC242_57 TaxID=3374624 RepID=UPI0037A52C70